MHCSHFTTTPEKLLADMQQRGLVPLSHNEVLEFAELFRRATGGVEFVALHLPPNPTDIKTMLIVAQNRFMPPRCRRSAIGSRR